MNQRKKKAFTLTELLVVVVIIGVLAAVVLPKFNKVIETRKTTEAEEIMAAVRTEQERRCALDKPYIGNINKLVTAEVLPQTETKNYTYSLESTGILASSRNKPYNLKMPSYADGRICCDGEECSKLNKEYLSCTELQAKPDYQQATACAAEIPSVSEPETTPACENGAEKTETCNGCGTYVTERCVNGQWTTVNESCSKTEEECSEDEEKISCNAWLEENGISETGIEFCSNQGSGLKYKSGNMLEKDANEDAFIASCCGDSYCQTGEHGLVNTLTGESQCCAEEFFSDNGNGTYTCGDCPEEKYPEQIYPENILYLNGSAIMKCHAGEWTAKKHTLTAVAGYDAPFADWSMAVSNKWVSADYQKDCNAYFIGTQAGTSCPTQESAEEWCNTQCKGKATCNAVCYSEQPDWGSSSSVSADVQYVSSCGVDGNCSSSSETVSFGIPAGYTFVGWTSPITTTTSLNNGTADGSHKSMLTEMEYSCGSCGVNASCREGNCTAYTLNMEIYPSSSNIPGTHTAQGSACLKRTTKSVSGYACVPIGGSRPQQSACEGLSTGICYVD